MERINKILETTRLYFRELTPEDQHFAYTLNADPEVLQYTGDDPFTSIVEARSFLENYTHYQQYGYGRWGVALKSTHELIGWCGLKWHPQPDNYVDLGYRFYKKYWGQGFATEAAKACIEFGFAKFNFNQIVGRVATENIASVRVLEKVGMQYWKKDTCEGIEGALYYNIYRPKN